MEHPWNVIEELRTSKGITWTRWVLNKHHRNGRFLKTLRYAYDPNFTYGIKGLDKKLPLSSFDYDTLTNENNQVKLMFDLLNKIALRVIKGGEIIKAIGKFCSRTDKKTAHLLYAIIRKDLRSGLGKKVITEIFPDLINNPPYMGAVPYSPQRLAELFRLSLSGKVYAENKADGLYGALICTGESWYIESRQGKRLYGMDTIINEAIFLNPNSNHIVITGEIMVKGFERHVANGIVNSIKNIREKEFLGTDQSKDRLKFFRKHGIKLGEAEKLIYMEAWDYIPLEKYRERAYYRPRDYRMKELEEFLGDSKIIKVIDYIVTDKPSEVYAFFQRQLAKGLEGLVIKTTDGVWQDGKPVWQVKMKIEFISDLKVIDYIEGKHGTQFEGSCGSVICATEDGLLVTKVSGLTPKERLDIWTNKEDYRGMIIGVKCNGVCQSKTKDTYAMLHAVFNRIAGKLNWRDDKREANTLEEVISIENSKKLSD